MAPNQRLLAFLLLAGVAVAAPPRSEPAITTVDLLAQATNPALSRGGFVVDTVVDRRQIAVRDPRLLGSTSLGLFEERSWLRVERPLAEVVRDLANRWTPASAGAVRVRLELLSLETWTTPAPGPDPAWAKALIRVVSLDSARPGVLLTPMASAQRRGLNTPAEQAALFRETLHDALEFFASSDWKSITPGPVDSASGPTPDAWTDAARPVAPAAARGLRQMGTGSFVTGLNGTGLSGRYHQWVEPGNRWVTEYWGGASLRTASLVESSEGLSLELAGGLGWQRRLGAGSSDWAIVQSVGLLLGEEWPEGRDAHSYIGGEGRMGLRYQPPAQTWAAGGGLHAAMRMPSRFQLFDLGIFLEGGWKF